MILDWKRRKDEEMTQTEFVQFLFGMIAGIVTAMMIFVVTGGLS